MIICVKYANSSLQFMPFTVCLGLGFFFLENSFRENLYIYAHKHNFRILLMKLSKNLLKIILISHD